MNTTHTVLPPDAQAKLQKAAEVQNTAADPFARTKAVEKAINWVRHKYPQFYKPQ